MTSLKGRIFNFLLRNKHLFQGKLKKESFDLDTSIIEFRERCEKGAARFGKLPDGIHIEEEMIAGIRSEWIRPAEAPKEKLIFYVHGGGYVSGSCNDHRNVVSKIADYIGISCVHYEYKLAPEFPFPHALTDSLEVYKEVLQKGFKPEDIIIMGESAGGGLSLAILLALKENNIHMPKAAVAISPWTDLTCSGESYKTKGRVSVAPSDSWTVFSHHYIGENDANNPLISPLFGDLKGLPPIFINSAVDDELFDDGKQFFVKAQDAGVDITFIEGKRMLHCYPLLAPMFREASEAMDEISNFIKLHMFGSKG